MQMVGLARLGRDCELRTTPSGEKVTNLSLAFNYGRKDPNTGDKPTQWVEAALWGKLAEVLVPYLKKGQQVVVTLDEPHLEEFQNRNGGTGTKLVARVSSVELCGARLDGASAPAAAPRAAPAPAPRPAPAPAPAADPFGADDSDIPF